MHEIFFKPTKVVFKNVAEESVITQISLANFFFSEMQKHFKNKQCFQKSDVDHSIMKWYQRSVPWVLLKVWCTAPPCAEKHVVSISRH